MGKLQLVLIDIHPTASFRCLIAYMATLCVTSSRMAELSLRISKMLFPKSLFLRVGGKAVATGVVQSLHCSRNHGSVLSVLVRGRTQPPCH